MADIKISKKISVNFLKSKMPLIQNEIKDIIINRFLNIISLQEKELYQLRFDSKYFKELAQKTLKQIISNEKDKEEQKKFIEKFYDQLTLARYTSQDYDDTIKECQKAIDENYPLFSIYNRMGICFFKKGRHVKARDAFLKAKEKFPNEEDKIAEKYLKMALEEIENY